MSADDKPWRTKWYRCCFTHSTRHGSGLMLTRPFEVKIEAANRDEAVALATAKIREEHPDLEAKHFRVHRPELI